MHKKISEMADADKAEFLEPKTSLLKNHGILWEVMEAKVIQEIEDTFDDEKFVKWTPIPVSNSLCQEGVRDRKLASVDYLLWMLKFVTGSDYVDF